MEKIKLLIPGPKIESRVKELGREISSDYRGLMPILVSILKGSFLFLSDLTRNISITHEIDFLSVSSYGSSTQTSGVVRLLKDLGTNIQGRDVLVVEDIVDTGLTWKYIRENLLTRDPSSLRIVTLLDKRERRMVDVPVDYVGFVIPDRFVVGYGLDYEERYRNLPYIGALDNNSLQGSGRGNDFQN